MGPWACTLGVRRLSGFMMYFDLSCREIIVAWEWWYNSQMRKPLFAGALLIAIAVAIIVRKVSAVEPWLNVWMPVCGSVSDWSHFKSCMARHDVHVDDRDLFVHTARYRADGHSNRRLQSVRMGL